MNIMLAKHAGFCFGVKRATQLAFEAAEKNDTTFTLGPIIHSPQVVNKLADMGVSVVKNLDEVCNGTVIIRSHGVLASELENAYQKQLSVIDATCPFVKKAQKYAKDLSEDGYDVIVVGDSDHPEVQGIVSYARPNHVHVASSGEDLKKLPNLGKVGIVAQTTQSFDRLASVVEECLKHSREMRVYNTICDATAVRQNEAVEMANSSDCMIVIGGHNSANTCRLAELCRELQPNTHHIETAAEIDNAWFQQVTNVGVTAGASTPKWIIEEVVLRLEQINNSH